MIWPLQREMAAFYGDPDKNDDDRPDAAWESANLTRIIPPYPMVLAWAPDKAVKTIWCHKLIAQPLTRCLVNIQKHYKTQDAIRKVRMHLFGGCYNFRRVRGGKSLSTHAYGAAIDLDPENNPLGRVWSPGMIPHEVVKIFRDEGATWGGEWRRPDCQHFQWADV